MLCYGSNGQGVCDLIGWGSYGSVSYCFFLGDMHIKLTGLEGSIISGHRMTQLSVPLNYLG